MAYSEKVVDHYENPRNVGAFEKGDESVGDRCASAGRHPVRLAGPPDPRPGRIRPGRTRPATRVRGCATAAPRR